MSAPRSMHVRTKVVALLVCLVALWGFAAFVTARDGLHLLWVSTLDHKYGRPTDTLILALQQERRLSAVYLGSGGQQQRAELDTQRAQTDQARANLETLAKGNDVRLAASEAAKQRVNDLLTQVQGLEATRASIDARRMDRGQAAATYTGIINAGFQIFGSLSSLDDQAIAKDGRTIVALKRAREIVSQEDALLAGSLASGKLTATDHDQFVELVGTERFLYNGAATELPDSDRATYDQKVASPEFARFRSLEDAVVTKGDARTPPVTAAAWRSAAEPVLAGLRDVVQSTTDATADRATPVAVWIIVRLALVGGLGLIAVIASIVIAISTARGMVRQLDRLRLSAWELATQRLPGVMERLGHGEKVDVAAEMPPLALGSDEIGQVGQAFNAVQETALAVAVEQAELRRGVRDLFLGLARRSQALIHRQLSLLDAIERRETDPEELSDLFRVDHLATRMRRNAENLIVLSGAVPGRRWRNPVPMIDVVRGALAEVEDYTRVTVLPIEPASLAGHGVNDVIHLLAELIENAASFSPPYTIVQVAGQIVANGFVVEIEDRGLGMSDVELAAANELIRNPPEFSLTSTARLGLYVIGRLSERHGIRVELRPSPYGGTRAIVLIPSALVDHTAASPALTQDPSAAALPSAPPHGSALPEDTVLPGNPLGSSITAGPAGSSILPEMPDTDTSLASGNGRVATPVEPPAGPADRPAPVGFVDRPAGLDPVLDDPTQTQSLPVRRGGAVPPIEWPEPEYPDVPRLARRQPPPERPFTALPPPPPPSPAPRKAAPPRPAPPSPAPPSTAPMKHAAPAESEPPAAPSPPAPARTPAGLPMRVRQANLAAPLREDPAIRDTAQGGNGAGSADKGRSPEQIRAMMGSYQKATERGRREAERSMEAQVPPAELPAAESPAHRAPEPPPNPTSLVPASWLVGGASEPAGGEPSAGSHDDEHVEREER